MANVKFLIQGESPLENHRLALTEMLEMKSVEGVVLSTAFLRSDGVVAIRDSLNGVNDKTRVFAGCRNGVTSYQGVMELVSTGVEIYLVDTGTGRFIFHPKVYLVHGARFARSIVGSANMTLGGLVKNIEASAILELNLEDEEDSAYFDKVVQSLMGMIEKYPENVIRVSNSDDVQKLFEDGMLVDERISNGPSSVGNSVSKDKTFLPAMKIKTEQYASSKPKGKRGEMEQSGGRPLPVEEIVVGDPSDFVTRLKKVWVSKALKERDLNIPTGSNTHATGSMTLKKGDWDGIDQRHYFRDEVFNELVWAKSDPRNPDLEYAAAEFHIIVEGINCGKFILELKHDPRTDTQSYRQNNAMTHLKWKEAKAFIAQESLLGKTLNLFKVIGKTGEFVIDIS